MEVGVVGFSVTGENHKLNFISIKENDQTISSLWEQVDNSKILVNDEIELIVDTVSTDSGLRLRLLTYYNQSTKKFVCDHFQLNLLAKFFGLVL